MATLHEIKRDIDAVLEDVGRRVERLRQAERIREAAAPGGAANSTPAARQTESTFAHQVRRLASMTPAEAAGLKATWTPSQWAAYLAARGNVASVSDSISRLLDCGQSQPRSDSLARMLEVGRPRTKVKVKFGKKSAPSAVDDADDDADDDESPPATGRTVAAPPGDSLADVLDGPGDEDDEDGADDEADDEADDAEEEGAADDNDEEDTGDDESNARSRRRRRRQGESIVTANPFLPSMVHNAAGVSDSLSRVVDEPSESPDTVLTPPPQSTRDGRGSSLHHQSIREVAPDEFTRRARAIQRILETENAALRAGASLDQARRIARGIGLREPGDGFGGMLGPSADVAAMREIIQKMADNAPYDALSRVLESGDALAAIGQSPDSLTTILV